MEFKQDMPPPGGYAPVMYERVPMKSGWNWKTKLGLLFMTCGVGVYILRLTKYKRNNERIEMRCARIALTPMLFAEVDRMFLKQIRRNRDEEERIMKNVKGWEVGKYFKEPVYLSLDKDDFFVASAFEYYAHANEDEMYNAFNVAKLN